MRGPAAVCTARLCSGHRWRTVGPRRGLQHTSVYMSWSCRVRLWCSPQTPSELCGVTRLLAGKFHGNQGIQGLLRPGSSQHTSSPMALPAPLKLQKVETSCRSFPFDAALLLPSLLAPAPVGRHRSCQELASHIHNCLLELIDSSERSSSE